MSSDASYPTTPRGCVSQSVSQSHVVMEMSICLLPGGFHGSERLVAMEEWLHFVFTDYTKFSPGQGMKLLIHTHLCNVCYDENSSADARIEYSRIEVQAQVYTHVYNPVGSASHEAKACHTIQKKDLDKKKIQQCEGC